jgi:RNA polymerase sigma-70 factor, ECF subfamily
MDAPPLSDESAFRPLLVSIGYRMTGSVAEAEDLVQEAYSRMDRARKNGVVVESPKAYLTAATTRLAINHLRSARARRESYVGTWLPEPVISGPTNSPEQMAELSDSLSMAFLLLLESLSPVERAVFLLREVFDYPYEDIAKIVEKSEANCRQIFARARQHVSNDQPRYEASREQSETLVRSFLAAARDGDLGQFVDLLAADAAFYSDGGGKATSTAQPLFGRDRIAGFLAGIFEVTRQRGITLEPAVVNGGPGVITHDRDGKIVSVLSLEILGGVVQTIRGIVNPDKLRHLGPVSEFLRIPDS